MSRFKVLNKWKVSRNSSYVPIPVGQGDVILPGELKGYRLATRYLVASAEALRQRAVARFSAGYPTFRFQNAIRAETAFDHACVDQGRE